MVPKKKLSKKEKLRLAAEQAEQERIELEKERQRLIQEEKARVERKKIAAEEKAKQDVAEQTVRVVQLQETAALLKHSSEQMYKMKLEKHANKEWEQYMKCDGLPDPVSVSEMNTYIYLWRAVDERGLLEDVVKRTAEVLELLGIMQELIDNPLTVSPKHVENWKQVQHDIRMEQQFDLDRASYLILRNIEENMQLSGLNEVRYVRKFDNFVLCLWSLLPLPTPSVPLSKTERPSLACDFVDVGVAVNLPESLLDVLLVVRAMLVKYDHFSDLCPSWVPNPIPEEEQKDLYEMCLVEWDAKCELQLLVDKENDRRAQLAAKIAAMKPVLSNSGDSRHSKSSSKNGRPPLQTSTLESELLELQRIQQTPVKTASELYTEQEDERQAAVKLQYCADLKPHELNLRKYMILGGVYHIDLLQQPPQPQNLHDNSTITVLQVPAELRPVEFHEKYVPPPPPEPGQRRLPEEIEAELKQQEQELEKLALMSIELPGNVLWFEPPIVAGWDKDAGFWSTENFHDLKFNEEKQVLTFRTGRFGAIGLAAYRYANLPYQSWELKPNQKGEGVSFSITAAVMIVEFLIKGDKVCVTQLQNGATEALQEIVGTYYSPYQLKKLMCSGGVDLFPLHDAYCYIDGATPKHRAAEDHLYHCMAFMSTSHSFSWSRWNLLAGRRNMVLQMKEFLEKKRQKDYSLLLVSPQKACIVDCTEMSQSFTDECMLGMKFYSDLYHLALDRGSPAAIGKINDIPFTLAETVFEMLATTRGCLEDELPDEPGQGLDEEEEEVYDALNDETFGSDAVEGDWEEDHEKLAEITEQSRIHRNSYNNDNHIESDDHTDLDLEASISQLVLEDCDDPIVENGEATKSDTLATPLHPSGSTGAGLVESSSYSSSAPSGYSVWGVGKHDNQQQKPTTQPVLPGVKNVCTVEELERGLISQRNVVPIAPPPGLSKPSVAMRLEDIERDLTTSNPGVGSTSSFPVVTLGLGRGQPQPGPFTNQDVVVMRNTQNSAPVGPVGRSSGITHFPSHLTGPVPQPVLGLGRGAAGNATFGQVMLPSRLLGPHPAALGVPDLRQLQQQNHGLMGSAPNLLRFIPQHLIMQSQPALRHNAKSLGHHNFATENGILQSIHPHCNNMNYRTGFQGPLVDHRMPVPGHFSLRPDHVMGSHYVNNRSASANFSQHHGHRGSYNSHYNSYSSYRQHQHHTENGSGEYDEYAGLMTTKEKQWLLNIQLLQLNTSQPYIDDYYYTVFSSRQPRKNTSHKGSGEICDSFGHRERRDSHRDRDQRSDQQQGTSRVYTPAQFENSLGKLQVGSVTAPRKIIDMDVVSHEGLDSTIQSLQRDSRKAKQLLLEIERLYLLLLQVEDLTSSVPEVKQLVTEEKTDLLHKIVSSLLVEDRLTSLMCVRKGKLLLLRVLPHLTADGEEEGSHLVQVWSIIFRGLAMIGKRDQASDESLLPRFYPHFKTWLTKSQFPALMEIAYSLMPGSRDSSRTTSPVTLVLPAKNVLVYALRNKFGVSSLAAMMEHGEMLYPTLEEKQWHEWTSFIQTVIEAVGSVSSPSSLPTPIDPVDTTLLNQHLGRCSSLQIEKYAVLECVFTGRREVEVENKESKTNS